MRVEIVVTSHRRLQSLLCMLYSIATNPPGDIGVHIMVEDDPPTAAAIKSLAWPFDLRVLESPILRRWPIAMNDVISRLDPQAALLYGMDDMVLSPDCIATASAELLRSFPDTDGVMAVNRIIEGPSAGGYNTCIGLVGPKFRARFPNDNFFCPEYQHHAPDSELGRCARDLGRLRGAGFAVHLHPKDATAAHSASNWSADSDLFDLRMSKGLIWGINFDLIGEKA